MYILCWRKLGMMKKTEKEVGNIKDSDMRLEGLKETYLRKTNKNVEMLGKREFLKFETLY